MPRETILPPLGNPPKGYTWKLTRITGHVGGKFGEKGFTYTIHVSKHGQVILQETFFIPMNREYDTLNLIGIKEKEIKQML